VQRALTGNTAISGVARNLLRGWGKRGFWDGSPTLVCGGPHTGVWGRARAPGGVWGMGQSPQKPDTEFDTI